MLVHHARVLRLSAPFAGRPIIFVCERNKGHEAEFYFQHFRQAIEPGVALDEATSRVFPIQQLDNMPTGKKLVHGHWTTAKEKQCYHESIVNHMGTARDLIFERCMFSVCPFQLSEVDMTPEKLAKMNRAKLILQCRRCQHLEEESTSALGMSRSGFSGKVDLHMKRNANERDDYYMALGIALRNIDLLRGAELREEAFPYRRFQSFLHSFSRR